MKPEIEAKFLNADHAALRRKLQTAGATLVRPKRLMKRKNYDFADKRLERIGGWVRARDEGDKITLSYKRLHNRELDGTHEVSLVVDSFANTDAFLRAIGLRQTSYQETKRESWQLDDCEVELDEWPWIRPFVEIEGPNGEGVRNIAAMLGLDWARACHGSVEIAYHAEYDVTDEEVNGMPEISYRIQCPAWLEKRRRA